MNKKPFSVHTEAIAQQSKVLNALINGRMIEAQKRSATLEDVDEGTFIRFCQFAYTGDYAVPLPSFNHVEEAPTTCEVRSKHGSVSPELVEQAPEYSAEHAAGEVTREAIDLAPAEPDDDWGMFSSPRKVKKPSRKIRLKRSFEDNIYPLPESQEQFSHECAPRPNSSAEEDYTSVFLGYASLYVFADKYGVESLRALTLNKLHKTLLTFTLYHARVGDVIKLVSFAYSSENTPDHEYIVDELRALVTHYVACEVDTIAESELFLSLLEEGGPFVRDFWMKVKKRIM